MEYGRAAEFSSGNGGGGANWAPGSTDQAIWATEDDYRAWNNGNNVSVENFSDSSFDGPPNKKSKNTQTADSQANNRSKAIGKMFFKTKLCCKFRAGTCPYTTNCNFAHSIEELRRPPSNWHDIVAAHEEEQRVSEPREEYQIPTVVDSYNFVGESARSYKGRRCKKFYTDEGCPYGDNCTFLHDEQLRARESVAISLNPGTGVGYGVEGVASNVKPPTWKTRICNKWEMTGYCPFGNKCHFAHGAADTKSDVCPTELHQYGGGLVESESGQSLSVASDSKQGVVVAAKSSTDVVVASMSSIPHSDFYRTGVVSQRTSSANVITQRPGQNPLQKWKGPHKISRIYGDWIDDIE